MLFCLAQMPGAPAGPRVVSSATALNPMADAAYVDALTGALRLVVPEAILLGVACLLFVVGLFTSSRVFARLLALAGIVAAGAVAVMLAGAESSAYADADTSRLVLSPIDSGPTAAFIRWVALGLGALYLLISTKEAGREIAADYYACLLVLIAGTSLAARANDLVGLFLALELISIPTYVLLYLPSQSRTAQEAAVKYFLLSILSSAVLLFGFSYLYGMAGSTNFTAISQTFYSAGRSNSTPLVTLAVVLATAGIGFRITAFPFHYYAPDVYQGAPTGVVSQLAVVPKVAGFIALARVLGMLTPPVTNQPFPAETQIPLMLWVMAAVTMTVGNVLALLQDNLKRLLAYSGVAHAGYMLLGLVATTGFSSGEVRIEAATFIGIEALLFYLVAYALMTIGIFAVLAYLNSQEEPVETLDDLAGVGQSHPAAAACLAISLLSLIGIPLTAGFSGKLLLFLSAFKTPTDGGLGLMYRVLVFVAAINAAIGAVYYLRMLGVIYLRSPLKPTSQAKGLGPILCAAVCAIATIAIGVYPKMLADPVRSAVPLKGKALTMEVASTEPATPPAAP